MSNSYNYLPIPPRVWSRVQNPCTYIVPDNSYNSIYIPLTNQTVSLAQANLEEKIQYKGNILQYKGNSSRITKNQKYSQISKGLWCNRTKVFATQSQTYTNPNTTSLARVNYTSIPFPNQIVGSPNNISGPFQYGIPNPNNCNTTTIQDGGSLLCGSYANPCTGEIVQTVSEQQCFPTYCSDVPGQIMDLCWNPKLQTFFPRNRLTMSNSLNKWPQGYKGLIGAVKPDPPVLLTAIAGCGSVELSWSYLSNNCISISNFKIYANGVLKTTVSYTVTSITINGLNFNKSYSFYVKSYAAGNYSVPSNTLTTTTYPLNTPSLSISSYITTPSPGVILSLSLGSTECTTTSYSYNLYTSLNGSSYSSINIPSGTNPLNYTVNLSYNNIYYFYITYVANNGNESSPSTTVGPVYTTIDAPTGFAATGTSPTTGTLNWSSPSSQFVTSYTISGSTSGSTTSTSYSLSGLSGNTSYNYYVVANYNSQSSSQTGPASLVTSQYFNITNVQSGYSVNTNVSLTSGPGNYYYMFTATNNSGSNYSNPSSPNVDLGILYNFTVNYNFNPKYLLVGGGGYGNSGAGGGGGGIITGTSLSTFSPSTTYTASVGGFGSIVEANGGASSIGIGTNGTGISNYYFRVTGGVGGTAGGTAGGGNGTIVNGSGYNNPNGGAGGIGINSPGGNTSYNPFNDSNLSITISGTSISNIYCGGGGGSGATSGLSSSYGYAGHGYGGLGGGGNLQSATAPIGYISNYLSTYTGLFYGGGGGGYNGGTTYGNGSTGVVILYWTQ